MRNIVHPSERKEHLELKRLFDADRLEEIDFTDKLMDQIYKRDSFKTKRWSILQPLRTFKGIAFVVIIITLISSSAYAAYEKSISLKDRDGNVMLTILPPSGEASETRDPREQEIMNAYRKSLKPGESISFIFVSKEVALKNIKIGTYLVRNHYEIKDIESFPYKANSPLSDYHVPGKKIANFIYDGARLTRAIESKYTYTTNLQPEIIDTFTFAISSSGVEYGFRKNHELESVADIGLVYRKGNKEIMTSVSYSEPFSSSPDMTIRENKPLGSLYNFNGVDAYYSENSHDTYKSILWMEKKNYRTYTHRISSFQATKKELLAFAEEVIGK
jgi:hypothetical protein